VLLHLAFAHFRGVERNADPDNAVINVLIRRRRHMAMAAAAVLAIGAAGAVFMLHGTGGKARDRADVRGCGLVACAVLRVSGRSDGHSGGAVAIGAPVRVERPGHTPSAAPARSPAPSPGPSASPVPVPQAPAPAPAPPATAVTIAYSTPDVWDGGFQGEFTIVNHGNSTLENWQVVIALPGDQVDTAWDGDWQPGPAGTVILTPASYDAPLRPGASQQVNFVATGSTVEPASCTFDGSACT
jgi:Cellulose binding domain